MIEHHIFTVLKSGLNILHPPKTFGKGTHSFSVFDPDGIEVEFTYHPPIVILGAIGHE